MVDAPPAGFSKCAGSVWWGLWAFSGFSARLGDGALAAGCLVFGCWCGWGAGVLLLLPPAGAGSSAGTTRIYTPPLCPHHPLYLFWFGRAHFLWWRGRLKRCFLGAGAVVLRRCERDKNSIVEEKATTRWVRWCTRQKIRATRQMRHKTLQTQPVQRAHTQPPHQLVWITPPPHPTRRIIHRLDAAIGRTRPKTGEIVP